ncbi:MFS transporter [Williamsia sterculiae]|uniref:MFS transporter n=1 Tax=Williamsia sterculiae TaxID=1344003 RepID=UPI00117D8F6E|nr:MFS transporter [Williamsia sterculiae]
MVVVSVAAMMAVIDGTIVTASLRDIGADLGAPLSQVVWLTVGYLISAGVTMPLSGCVIDRLGPRRTLFWSLALFVSASILCSVAWSLPVLILFRVLQGFAGGLLEPTAVNVAASSAPAARMGAVMSVLSSTINIGPVVGPLLGSLIAGSGHWPWIFLINVPLGAIAIVGAAVVVRPMDGAQPRGSRPDLIGMVLLPLGFVSVLLSIDRVGVSVGGWLPILLGVFGVAVLAAYGRYSLRGGHHAVLDLTLLRHRGFRAALLTMAAVGFAMYGQLVGLPLIAAEDHGLTGIAAGLPVAALGVGCLVSMTTAGRMSDRLGTRPIVVTAAVLTAGVAVAIAVSASWLPLSGLLSLMVVFGLTFGGVAAPTFSSIYRTVPPDRAPYATPSLFITVQLAAAGGATVAGLLVDHLAPDWAATWLYGSFTVLLLAAAGVARWLPGRQ